MAGLQNLHTHTTFCDGAITPEEMVIAAIEKGCDSFGLSGHSYALHDTEYCMSQDGTRDYITEVRRLKEKYAGRIEILLGVEQDYYSDMPADGFDFVIGGLHCIEKGNYMVRIDSGANLQKHGVNTYYHGDYYAMLEEYYAIIADLVRKTGADIVAHFDLVTIYNSDGNLFDENHPRYVNAALGAMEEILKSHKLFEVNTGAMYRFSKKEPYPSMFLLKELCKRGGEIILSSDSHHAESICYKFDEMQQLLKTCGFKYIKRLTKDGFINIPL